MKDNYLFRFFHIKGFCKLLIFLSFLISFSSFLNAQSKKYYKTKELEKKIEHLKNVKKDTLFHIKDLRKSEWKVLQVLKVLRQQQNQSENYLINLANKFEDVRGKLNKKKRILKQKRAKIISLRKQVERDIQQFFQFKMIYKMTSLTGMSYFQNFKRNQFIVQEISTQNLNNTFLLQKKVEEEKVLMSELEEEKEKLAELELEADNEYQVVLQERKNQEIYFQELRNNKKLKLSFLSEIQQEVEEINNTVYTLKESKEIEKKISKRKGFRKKEHSLPKPVSGEIIQKYGQKGVAHKRGMLIVTPNNEAVISILEGKVAFKGPFYGYNNLIIIDHGKNSFSVYGNLDKVFVQKDDIVKSNQMIGRVGLNPIKDEYIFYFETRYRGKAVNPMKWLRDDAWEMKK